MLALSFAVYGYSFGQHVTKTEPQAVDHSGIKPHDKQPGAKAGKNKNKGDKYDKHKHKHNKDKDKDKDKEKDKIKDKKDPNITKLQIKDETQETLSSGESSSNSNPTTLDHTL